MKNPLIERPWLLVVVALAAFVLAWSIFVVFAQTHPAQSVPLHSARPAAD